MLDTLDRVSPPLILILIFWFWIRIFWACTTWPQKSSTRRLYSIYIYSWMIFNQFVVLKLIFNPERLLFISLTLKYVYIIIMQQRNNQEALIGCVKYTI